METIRLAQFCRIVETGNLRRAADLLGISHSGLSKSIKVLEDELGYRLLLPSGRGIVITDAGTRLFERCGPFFDEFQKLVGNDTSQSGDLLRLGSFEVFTCHFMGKLMGEFFLGAAMEVHELIPGRLEEALLMNKVDVGITYEPIPRKGIEYIRTATLTMMPYVRRAAFKGQNILEIPFVVPVNPLEGAPSGVKGLDGWPDNKFKRLTPYSVDLLNTGFELVRQGLCAVFIPQFVAELHNESAAPELKLEIRDLPKGMRPVKRDVFIVKRESSEESQALQKIARALRKYCH